jgi:hypothetical protein
MDKQQRFFILPEIPTAENDHLYKILNDYLKEGWFIISTTSSNNSFFIVIEKDFTLK